MFEGLRSRKGLNEGGAGVERSAVDPVVGSKTTKAEWIRFERIEQNREHGVRVWLFFGLDLARFYLN